MLEEYNKLLKVKAHYQGNNQWFLQVEKDLHNNQITGKGSITFRGDDKEFAKLLKKLKAKDTKTEPASIRNGRYIDLVNEIKEKSSGEYIWIWNKDWIPSLKIIENYNTGEHFELWRTHVEDIIQKCNNIRYQPNYLEINTNKKAKKLFMDKIITKQNVEIKLYHICTHDDLYYCSLEFPDGRGGKIFIADLDANEIIYTRLYDFEDIIFNKKLYLLEKNNKQLMKQINDYKITLETGNIELANILKKDLILKVGSEKELEKYL